MFSLRDKQKRRVQLRKTWLHFGNFVSDLGIKGHPDSNGHLAGGERVKRNIYNSCKFFSFAIFHISPCRNMIITPCPIVTFPVRLYLGENYPKHGQFLFS